MSDGDLEASVELSRWSCGHYSEHSSSIRSQGKIIDGALDVVRHSRSSSRAPHYHSTFGLMTYSPASHLQLAADFPMQLRLNLGGHKTSNDPQPTEGEGR